MFIPDPDLEFIYTHPGPQMQRSKKALDPGSGTLRTIKNSVVDAEKKGLISTVLT
jgi:hypothetical protein